MKNILHVFILLFSIEVTAQINNDLKHVISTTPFKLERYSKTLHRKLRLKNYFGISYERIFNKWSLSIVAENFNGEINDNCNVCADHLYGIGHLKEYNFFTGVNFFPVEKTVGVSKFQLFTGTDFYYAHINYAGDFSGGFDGGGAVVNDTYNILGIQQRLGFHFYPIPQIRTSFTTSARIGRSQLKTIYSEETWTSNEFATTLIAFAIALLF